MIMSDSRYVDGIIVPMSDEKVIVRRRFPETVTNNPRVYTWMQSDRLDRIAAKYLGDSRLWWRIMDANPLIQAVGDIKPGMQIRIPRRV